MANLNYKLGSLSDAHDMGNLDYKLDSLSHALDMGNLYYKRAQHLAHLGTSTSMQPQYMAHPG